MDAGFWDFCSTVKEAIIGSQSHCDAFRQGRCMSELTLFFQEQSKVEWTSQNDGCGSFGPGLEQSFFVPKLIL